MTGDARWRHVVAALADPDRRELYARILVAEADGLPLVAADLNAGQRRRLRGLIGAGLVADGGTLVGVDAFSPLLAAAPPGVAPGPERFVRGGRVLGLPRRSADREALFELLAARVLAPDEVVDEATITGRLAGLTDDPVAWRRYLVDAGVLVRDPAGRRYERAR